MIASVGAYFKQEFQMSPIIGSALVCVLCYFAFLSNIDGIVKINTLCMPILIFFIIFLGIKSFGTGLNFANNYLPANNILIPNWFMSAVIYASYNSIVLIPIMISLKNYIQKKEDIHKVAIISTLCIFILASVLFLLMNSFHIQIGSVDLPIIHIASIFGNVYRVLLGIVILLAIFTSAISIGFSFLKNLAANKHSYNKLAIFMVISGFVVSFIGYSNLLSILYPAFGYLGLLQLIFIVKSS